MVRMMGLDRAKQLLEQNALEAAELELWQVLRVAGEPRVHEAWLRLGELYASRGHLRRALGAFRRAQALDLRGEYAFLLHQAVSTLGQVLHAHQRPFLHPAEEHVRTERMVRHERVEVPSAEGWLAQADALSPSLPAPAREALEHAKAFVRRGLLDEPFSEQSPASDLEQKGGEPAKALAHALRDLHLAWYEALLERDER
jgi:tetratricopeptide (TPR) repeat protein